MESLMETSLNFEKAGPSKQIPTWESHMQDGNQDKTQRHN